MYAKLIGFNPYKSKDGRDMVEIHIATDIPMKNGCQVIVARIPSDPFNTLIVGQEYEVVTQPYTFNGELRSRIVALK